MNATGTVCREAQTVHQTAPHSLGLGLAHGLIRAWSLADGYSHTVVAERTEALVISRNLLSIQARTIKHA